MFHLHCSVCFRAVIQWGNDIAGSLVLTGVPGPGSGKELGAPVLL